MFYNYFHISYMILMHVFLVIIFSKLIYFKHCLKLYENVENVSALGIM